MKVSDSPTCVAYYFKNRRNIINAAYVTKGFEYTKSYVLWLIDKANKTKKQKSIRAEIASSPSMSSMLSVIDRVIRNGELTEFINYR